MNIKLEDLLYKIYELNVMHGDLPVYISVIDGNTDDFVPINNIRIENAGTIHGVVLGMNR